MSALFKTVKSFVASDESIHSTLNSWKTREIFLLHGPTPIDAEWIVDHADNILAILRQRERKPRTPSVKPAKAKRTRKPKAPVVADTENVTA